MYVKWLSRDKILYLQQQQQQKIISTTNCCWFKIFFPPISDSTESHLTLAYKVWVIFLLLSVFSRFNFHLLYWIGWLYMYMYTVVHSRSILAWINRSNTGIYYVHVHVCITFTLRDYTHNRQCHTEKSLKKSLEKSFQGRIFSPRLNDF